MIERNLAVAVAQATITRVRGTFQRHVSLNVRVLTGTPHGGRWGPPGRYSVLYLGRPNESVVVEAYRHLVDGIEGMTGDRVAPRRLLTCEVDVTQILDLRGTESRLRVGLTEESLGAWDHGECQRVGQAAHQLGLHGIIAPAATLVGETLALFEEHLPKSELPSLVGEEIWAALPPDPRQLRVIEGGQSSSPHS